MKTRILLSLFIAFNFCTASAQVVNIPDTNFKQALLTYSPAIDLNNDSQIQVSEALLVDQLWLGNKNIQDLTGIEAFKNIDLLICSANQLSTLQLSGLNKLYYLQCDRNNISSLQLSSLPALQYLDCSNNLMTDLQLTGADFPVLDLFRCTDNPLLTNADIHGMPALDWCEITGNYNLKKLNVSNSPLITMLLAAANNLDSINISGCVGITDLILVQNSLDTLDLSSQINLQTLDCANNSLRNLDLSSQINLAALNCTNNSLKNLDLRNQVKLVDLSCLVNPIESLDLSKCYNLINLYCGDSIASLKYMNTKNGRPGLWIGGVFKPWTLKYICANEEDVLPFVNVFAQQGAFNVNVNAYCSFTPGGNYNTIKGLFRFDVDGNGCDANDALLTDMKMNMSHTGQNISTFTNNAGEYIFYAQTGSYTVKPLLQNPYFSFIPDSATYSFASTNGTVKVQNFCAVKNGIHNDLETALIPEMNALSGTSCVYKLIIKNKGTETLSGSTVLNYDDIRVDFASASLNPDNQSTGSLTWNFSSLKPFETRTIMLSFDIANPPINYANDTLTFQATINPVSGDDTPLDNVFTLKQVIEGPTAPPMNINCMEGSNLPLSMIGGYIHYRIGFKNTGSDTAVNVVVKDVLDAKLNWSSIEITGTSHPVVVRQSQGKNLEFFFEKIKLPTSQQNPAAGKGYISFKIKTIGTLVQGDSVLNSAAVYFDNKPPVTTNISKIKFAAANTPTAPVVNLGADISQCGGTILLNAANQGSAYLWSNNATTQTITVNTSGTYWVRVTNAQGLSASDTINITVRPKPIVSFSLVDTIYTNAGSILLIASPAGGQFSGPAVSIGSFDPAVAGTGLHALQYSYTDVYGCNTIATEDILVKAALNSVTIYPNPNRGSFTIVLPDSLRNTAMEIVTAAGITVIKKNISSSQEHFKLSLPAGMYYLRLTNTGFSQTERIIIW